MALRPTKGNEKLECTAHSQSRLGRRVRECYRAATARKRYLL